MSQNTDELRTIWNGSGFIDIEDISILSQANQQLANAVATGPQDEFFEELERTNNTIRRYVNMNFYGYQGWEGRDSTTYDLHITPSWNWKPKTYDKVREMTEKILALHKKSSGIDKFIERTQGMNYRLRDIQDKFSKLETLKKHLKREGYSANVDIEEYKEKLTDFASKVRDECDKISEFGDEEYKLTAEPFIHVPENERDSRFYLILTLENLNMKIYQGNTVLQEFPLFPIYIVFTSKLRIMMKYIANPSYSNMDVNFKGLYDSLEFPPEFTGSRAYHLTEHPYIAQPSYTSNHQRLTYATVCFDKFLDDVKKSFHDMDYIKMILTILSWATYYNTDHANPYNQPTSLHLGMPEKFNKAYKALYPSNYSNCSIRMRHKYSVYQSIVYNESQISNIIKMNKECNSLKCVWRDDCSQYKLNNEVLESIQDTDEQNEKRFEFESILGFLNDEEHIYLDEVLESDYGIPYKLYDSFNDIITQLLATGYKATLSNSLLTDYRYWGINTKIDIDEDVLTEKEKVLQWATGRRL